MTNGYPYLTRFGNRGDPVKKCWVLNAYYRMVIECQCLVIQWSVRQSASTMLLYRNKCSRKYTNPANPVRNICKQRLRPLPILFWTTEKVGIPFSGIITCGIVYLQHPCVSLVNIDHVAMTHTQKHTQLITLITSQQSELTVRCWPLTENIKKPSNTRRPSPAFAGGA